MQVKSLGKITVTTSGIPVPIWTGSAHYKVTKIRIIPLAANTGDIYVGLQGFDFVGGAGLIDHITPDAATGAGDRFLIESHDANTLYPATLYIDVDAGHDGEGAIVSVVEA
jgi:hypothetical protein